MFNLKIELDDDNLKNFIDYEKSLIKCVSEQNMTYFMSEEWPFDENMVCLQCMGVKYIDDRSFDNIEHISSMIEKGYGKCDSIVAWFMTVYKLHGIDSDPILIKRSEEELHAQIKIYENNKVVILDPSVSLNKICSQFCEVCK